MIREGYLHSPNGGVMSKDTRTWEKFKSLSRDQKIQYFRDYYLVQCLVMIIVLIGACSLIATVTNPSREVLSVIFLNESFVEDTAGLSDFLESYIGLERSKDYISVKYYDLKDTEMNVAYMVKTGTGDVDLVICSYDDFIACSQGGMLIDLREYLPEEIYQSLSGRIVNVRKVKTNLESNSVLYSDAIPFGINISGGTAHKDYIISDEELVLGVFASSLNTENALKAITYFIQ